MLSAAKDKIFVYFITFIICNYGHKVTNFNGENKGKNNLEFENEGDKQVNGNDDIKVDIEFNKVGHKRLMAKFANLEIIEN